MAYMLMPETGSTDRELEELIKEAWGEDPPKHVCGNQLHHNLDLGFDGDKMLYFCPCCKCKTNG